MPQDERTTQLLSSLSGRHDLDLPQIFAPGRVAVMLSEKNSSVQAQLIVSFAVNLMSRLYPVVQNLDVIVPDDQEMQAAIPRWQGRTFSAHLRSMLEAIKPPMRWRIDSTPDPSVDEFLAVGTGFQKGASVYLGCDRWEVSVSTDMPLPVIEESNPVSANAAACFGVSEIFKRLLARHFDLFPDVPIVPLTERLTFSTLTYTVGDGQENPALPARIDLGRLTFVGLGAGGGATAYTLASIPDLNGHVNLVEPDEINEPNLNRYVYADATDAYRQRKKTDVIAQLFRSRSEFSLSAYPEPFKAVASRLKAEDYLQVTAAVHSREARREIQYETPSVLWDAGATEDGEFRIWRSIFGQSECMFCKHPPSEQDPEKQKSAQLSDVLGLSADSLLEKIRNNGMFTKSECERIREHVGSSQDFELPLSNQRLDDWEAAQCGRLRLKPIQGDVPIPFSPVMAGVLIAGEIIKERVCPQFVLDSYYFNTLLGRFMKRIVPNRRAPRSDCEFCSDADFRAQYKRRRELIRESTPERIARVSST